jgi:hypothetical protein
MAPRVSATLLIKEEETGVGGDAICLWIPLLSSFNVPRSNTCVVSLDAKSMRFEIVFVSARIWRRGYVLEDFRPTFCPLSLYFSLSLAPSYIPTRHQSIPSHHVKVVASTDLSFL